MPRLRLTPTDTIKKNAAKIIKSKKELAEIRTIEELGKRIGVSKVSMGKYIYDVTKMPVGKMIRLFDVLQFSDDEKLSVLKG